MTHLGEGLPVDGKWIVESSHPAGRGACGFFRGMESIGPTFHLKSGTFCRRSHRDRKHLDPVSFMLFVRSCMRGSCPAAAKIPDIKGRLIKKGRCSNRLLWSETDSGGTGKRRSGKFSLESGLNFLGPSRASCGGPDVALFVSFAAKAIHPDLSSCRRITSCRPLRDFTRERSGPPTRTEGRPMSLTRPGNRPNWQPGRSNKHNKQIGEDLPEMSGAKVTPGIQQSRFEVSSRGSSSNGELETEEFSALPISWKLS